MEVMREYWAVFAGGVAGLVWLVRLEARSLANERDNKRLWAQRREDLEAAREARQQANTMLTEIREDVKAILRGRQA
jgi:hypothetical protein